MTITSIKLGENGEYEVILQEPPEHNFELRVLRNGEAWKSIVGDNFTLLMVFKIQKLRQEQSIVSQMIAQMSMEIDKTSERARKYSLELIVACEKIVSLEETIKRLESYELRAR